MEKKTFDQVSAATWQRLKDTGTREHGTVFEEKQDHSGRATTRTPMGTIVLDFEFDPAAERITYTIVEKPFLAPSSMIWVGLATALDRCRVVS